MSYCSACVGMRTLCVCVQLDMLCDCMRVVLVYVTSLSALCIFRLFIYLKLCYMENKGNLIHCSNRKIRERESVQ